MYFSKEDRGHMAAMVYNWPNKDVHIIVVTDGSRILGLGDLGVNGMGIPIGELALYCAAGGIAPHRYVLSWQFSLLKLKNLTFSSHHLYRVLPVVIDVGTNNEDLLNDEHYLGIQEPRISGDEYYSIVSEFMQAVHNRWPKVLVQFEDFSSDKAQVLLDNYRNDSLVFNDDIQGTGATTLAGILSALRVKGKLPEDLGEERILIVGAGSAGIGVGQVLLQAMIEQGRTHEESISAFFVADQHGLLGVERTLGKEIHSLRNRLFLLEKKMEAYHSLKL